LYSGISWVLEDKQRWNTLSAESRKKAERLYDINIISKRYTDLYQSILNSK
jgi:glycosyltransferase involved in cell wall biosynthesis